jgi:site-specific recombinase
MSKENLPVLNRSIIEVRAVLQDQLARLNKENVDIDKEHKRSQAIQMVATPLIASAKIEADLMARNPKFLGTGFISEIKKIEN